MRFLIIFFVFQLLCSCARPAGDSLFRPAKNLGKISDKLDEASGLVSGVVNEGKLWSINDSGNDASVFLIDDKARIELICTLANVKNRDWEDITNGRGPQPGINYLYVGDIGDNNARYDIKYIYRFAEPVFSGDKKLTITEFDTLILKLPDERRDTEAMMIDPLTNDLYVVSKREESVHLYRAAYPFAKDTIVMENLGKIPLKLIVAGAISADGEEILLKNYNKIFYWKRAPGESVAAALNRGAIRLSYDPEHQGEAIAWARDGSGFYTLSESSVVDRAQLRFYRRK